MRVDGETARQGRNPERFGAFRYFWLSLEYLYG